MRAAVVAVAAAAFAVEAFANAVADAIGRARQNENAHARIVRTLEAALEVPSQTSARWMSRLDKLFAQRVAIAHAPSQQTAPVAHPTRGNTSFESATFTVELAATCVDTMLAVLESSELPVKDPRAAQAAESMRAGMAGLTEQRRTLGA
jgi:hypothetical protein